MSGISTLTGTVKHYDWGGYQFIPHLLSVDNKDRKPFAEFWMGTHPQSDCRITLHDGSTLSLTEYISQNTHATLGDFVNDKFGSLPYLFKTLDVKDMLSIQVHPSKSAAKEDFDAENASGVPLDSPQRNYKDNNHKPELMVAVGPFWLLHGFKPEGEMISTLKSVPELNNLLPIFQSHGYKGLYRRVMEMPQEEVNANLQSLLDRITPLYQSDQLDRSSADFWAARAAITFGRPGITDRGIYSVYLFNLVSLQEGQAVFQDAGLPHAYLEGQNIEIMANSDNVLRGGLTTKHIDVVELLKHVRCEATHPDILEGVFDDGEMIYKTPAPDFELSSIALDKGDFHTLHSYTTDILLLISGQASLEKGDRKISLEFGTPSAVLFAGTEAVIRAKTDTLIFRATVPMSGI